MPTASVASGSRLAHQHQICSRLSRVLYTLFYQVRLWSLGAMSKSTYANAHRQAVLCLYHEKGWHVMSENHGGGQTEKQLRNKQMLAHCSDDSRPLFQEGIFKQAATVLETKDEESKQMHMLVGYTMLPGFAGWMALLPADIGLFLRQACWGLFTGKEGSRSKNC